MNIPLTRTPRAVAPRLAGLGLAALVGLAGLAGCASAPPPLYGWGRYQEQVYEHFKAQNKGPQEQLSALEADLQKIQAKGQAAPPGYHAHLGLLYASLGQDARAMQELQTEKRLFPESTVYIDRLLSKYTQ